MWRIKVFGVLVVICLLVLVATAQAQMFPGRGGFRGRYGGYDGYGSDGAWGAYTSAMNYATTANIAQSDRLMGQQAAMQQMAMQQSSIRNTIGSQAAMQTQNVLSQQQSGRDWWFQVQQQQAAQRHALPSGMAAAPARAFEPSPDAPKAETDIIKWLPVLCEPQFAEQRARVEAPYRRQPKANPTVEDYKNMIDAAEQMKVLLNEMAAQITAQQYLDAEAFLDKLATEAQGRIEKDTPPAKPK